MTRITLPTLVPLINNPTYLDTLTYLIDKQALNSKKRAGFPYLPFYVVGNKGDQAEKSKKLVIKYARLLER